MTTTARGVQRARLRAALLSVMLIPVVGNAAGLYMPMKGASSTSLAAVGMASLAEDGSTLFFNPAGATQLKGAFADLGADVVGASISISDRGSSFNTPGTLGVDQALTGRKGDNTGWVPVPSLFLGTPVANGDLWLGLAVTTPFGLKLKYAKDWFGRYDSYDNKLTTVNAAPSLAYRINDAWSVGGGIDFQYAKATLISALPDPLNPGGPTAATDGRSKLTGDDWDVGFNIGLMYHPSEQTRVGLHYRSGLDYELAGDVKVSDLRGPLAAANGSSKTHTRISLPDIASLSLTQAITPRLTLMGEVQWFGWDAFDEIRIKFDDGSRDVVRPQGYKNTYTVGLSAQYSLNPKWTLRGGVQYDQSPTTNALRNTSIPDSNLTWFGVGASYSISDRLKLDFGFVRGMFERAKIDLTIPVYAGTPLASTVNVRGETGSHVDTLSFALRYRFGS